jgi:hypothetical protein
VAEDEDLRSFFDRLGGRLGISNNYPAWLRVSVVDVMNFGGKKFLEHSGYKLLPLLQAAYPEHDWKRRADPLQRFPTALYSKPLRDRIGKAAIAFNIKPGDLSDWYNITHKSFWKAVGGPEKWYWTRCKALSSAFPEHTWHPWLFKFPTLRNILDEIPDAKFFALVREMEQMVGITKPEDWYDANSFVFTPTSHVLLDFALLIFQTKENSLRFLRKAYPNIEWDPSKMERRDLLPLLKAAYPEHQWRRNAVVTARLLRSRSGLSALRDRILNAGKTLNIKPGNLSDWYNVPHNTFWNAVGGAEKWELTRFKALSAAFPEHKWHRWLFKFSLKHNTMDEMSNDSFLALVREIEQKLNINNVKDWFKVSAQNIEQSSASLPTSIRLAYFQTQSKFLRFLRRAYPDIQWEPNKMGWSTLGWSHLRSNLEEMFLAENVVKRDKTLIIRNYNLSFEYCGPMSYAAEIIRGEDFLLKNHSKQRTDTKDSNTRIIIPFWWNREKNSLLGEIYQNRKDLFEEGTPLSSFKAIASTSNPISDVISRENVEIQEHHILLKKWRDDPRFSYLFESTKNEKSRKKPKTLKKIEKLRHGLHFTPAQRSRLLSSFEEEKYPNKEHLELISSQLGVDLSKVSRWYGAMRNRLQLKNS